MTFAEKLRWHRLKAGLSRRQLADAIGAKVGTVKSWELGQAEPRYRAFIDLCRLFKVPAAALESDFDPKPVAVA